MRGGEGKGTFLMTRLTTLTEIGRDSGSGERLAARETTHKNGKKKRREFAVFKKEYKGKY